MFLLRIVGVLTAITIGSSIVAWLVSRDRRYLLLAARVTQGAVLFALVILGLMALERILVI